MARIFTTAQGEATAKAWMHDLLVLAGIRTNDQRKIYSNSFARFSNKPVKEAQQVCNELINRDFANIDNSIERLSYYQFLPSLTNECNNKRYKPADIAKAIVYTAELLNLYWDDTVRTPYEIDEFKKTILGEAVFKYSRVISAIPDKAAKSKGTAAAKTTSSSSTTSTSSVPQNGYKSSGPQSGNVRDLQDINGGQGIPGVKVNASGQFIYKIIADKVGKNTPNVFIKPLSASGETNGTNKIFISSGNGYTDCTCYFDDPNDAQVFLDKIIQNNRVPSNIVNLRIVKMNADSNGYFLVGTEFGPVAVSAKTLNEALKESMEEIQEAASGWEKATKDYDKKELKELHDWMRRD